MVIQSVIMLWVILLFFCSVFLGVNIDVPAHCIPLPSVVPGHRAKLRLLEPSGGDERIRRHGGLQDTQEGWV